MEIKQEDMTPQEYQEKYREMEDICKRNLCAECGSMLSIFTVPENRSVACGCVQNHSHTGYKEKTSNTEDYRRGDLIHYGAERSIEKKMIPKTDLARAINMLSMRYPKVIKDTATASLFLVDCQRLDLDPLIQPAEAVPIAFTSHKDGKDKTTISMIVTSDGWLSMAARGCPNDFVGPPKTMRLEEYLASLPENKGKSYEELKTVARDIKLSDCGDPDAWTYVAVGKRRGSEECVSSGSFTHDEKTEATKHYLPAGDNPGNQARRRAIKHWIRDVFPDCRQRMIELTQEWMRRSEGIAAAQTYIDAEYSFIVAPALPTEGQGTTKKLAQTKKTEKQ